MRVPENKALSSIYEPKKVKTTRIRRKLHNKWASANITRVTMSRMAMGGTGSKHGKLKRIEHFGRRN